MYGQHCWNFAVNSNAGRPPSHQNLPRTPRIKLLTKHWVYTYHGNATTQLNCCRGFRVRTEPPNPSTKLEFTGALIDKPQTTCPTHETSSAGDVNAEPTACDVDNIISRRTKFKTHPALRLGGSIDFWNMGCINKKNWFIIYKSFNRFFHVHKYIVKKIKSIIITGGGFTGILSRYSFSLCLPWPFDFSWRLKMNV